MSVMNCIYLKETQACKKICLYYFPLIILQLAFKFATGAALVQLAVQPPNALKTIVRFRSLHLVGKICKLMFFLFCFYLYRQTILKRHSDFQFDHMKIYPQFFPLMIPIHSSQEWLRAGFFQTNLVGLAAVLWIIRLFSVLAVLIMRVVPQPISSLYKREIIQFCIMLPTHIIGIKP